MGVIDRYKNCDICGKSEDTLGDGVKLSDGFVCGECYEQVFRHGCDVRLEGKRMCLHDRDTTSGSDLTLQFVRAAMLFTEQDKIYRKAFNRTRTICGGRVDVDDEKGQMLVHEKSGDTCVFRIKDIQKFELVYRYDTSDDRKYLYSGDVLLHNFHPYMPFVRIPVNDVDPGDRIVEQKVIDREAEPILREIEALTGLKRSKSIHAEN